MRSLLLLFCFLYFLPVFSQDDCPGEFSEAVEYRASTSLCDIYGDDPPTVTIVNGVASSVFGGAWNNEVVSITGTFTIDVANFNISDCVVQMAPGGEIIVNNGNELMIWWVDQARRKSAGIPLKLPADKFWASNYGPGAEKISGYLITSSKRTTFSGE